LKKLDYWTLIAGIREPGELNVKNFKVSKIYARAGKKITYQLFQVVIIFSGQTSD
jgi:hypothetical protein